MKTPLLLTLSLLAGFAPAQTPEPRPASAEVVEYLAPEDDDFAAEMEDFRRSQHNPLNAILAFVHDRASANAAAPRVRALMATPEGKGLRPSGEVGLFLYAGHQCYGSETLMAEIRSLVPEDVDKPAFRRAELIRTTMTPFIKEMMVQLDRISDALAQVKDAESEAAAIALAKTLPACITDMAARMDAAADWLEKKNAELGRSLTALSPYHANKQGCCLCIVVLGERLQAAASYLSHARPAYFGSTKLQRLMDEAEDEAQMMPVPELRPLKK